MIIFHSLRPGFSKKLVGVSLGLLLALVGLLAPKGVAAITPAFVQQVNVTPGSGTSVNVAYSTSQTNAQKAGDTNVVAIGFGNTTGTISSVTDNKGNSYTVAAPLTRDTANSQAVYYAKNIATGAGNTVVTVTFNASVPYPDIRVVEYSGLDKVSPLDVSKSATGTGTAPSSGAVTTTNANDMIFGAGLTATRFTAAGSGFTSRVITADGNIAEDKNVATVGSYTATGTATSGKWIMQLVALKADNPVADTTPPSMPSSLSATAVSTAQINLNWTASTDNVGVTGYKIFRDGVQIATSSTTTYQNTGLNASTTYSYTVAAYDLAGNTSVQSTAAIATTLAPDTTAPSVSLTAPVENAVLTGSTSVTATASDNVGVTKVEFYIDGQLKNTDTTSPYGFTLDSTTLAFGAHVLTAQAYDAAGNVTATAPVDVTVDNTDHSAPSAPSNLSATAVSPSQITLSWTASTDNLGVTGYTVFRDGVQIATVTGTTYPDTGLAAGTLYDYTVAAFDAAGNVSTLSTDASATTPVPDTTAPSTPTGLTATAVSSSQINLAWNASSDDQAVTGYHIYRSGIQIGTTSALSFQATGLAANTAYSFTVCAFDAAGNESPATNPASATTLVIAGVTFPLKLSANGRYLVDQNNVPFLMSGDSPQGLIVRLPLTGSASSESYFADREAQGFNTVWVNILSRDDNGGTSNGYTFDGIAPFTVQDDLSKPNLVYFQRAHDMIAQAAQHHILVILDPAETIDHLGVLRSNGVTKDYNYGVFVANYFKDLPNIIWMSGNDYAYNTSDDQYVMAVAQGIKATDNPSRLQSVELYPTPVGSLSDPSWTSLINLDFAYTYAPAYAQVLTEYNRALNTSNGTMPTIMVESYYDYEQLPPINNYAQPNSTYRNQEYWTALSGAAGQVYGNYYTVRFPSGWNAPGNLDTPAVTQLGYLNGLLSGFHWYDLVPDQDGTFLTGGQGEYIGYIIHNADGSLKQNDYITAALTPDGKTGLMYLPTPRTITVNMSKLSDQVTARWFDPTTNSFAPIGIYANTGSRQFTPPSTAHADGAKDWVLVLTAAPSTPDVTAPSSPTGLAATAISGTRIDLTWAASTDDRGVTGYTVFRDGIQIGQTASTTYQDTGLSPSTAYSYTVSAFDAAGNLSSPSLVANATTPAADTMPPTISQVSISGVTGSAASISWTTDEASDSQIQYGLTTAYGTNTTLNTALTTSHTQNLSGLTPNTTYHYRVVSRDVSGNVAFSADAIFTTGTVVTTPQFVQSANVTSDASASNVSRAFASANTSGSLIAVAVSWGDTTGAPTCSDSQGNTYTLATFQYDSTQKQGLAICYASNIKAGANTVTVTFSGSSSYRRMVVTEYRGVSATVSVDVTAQNIAVATTGANGSTSGSATTTVSGDLIFGAVMDDSATTSITAGTGFTQRDATNGKDLAVQDAVQNAVGPVASTQTFGATHRYLAQLVAFKVQ